MSLALQITGNTVTTPAAWEEIKSDALLAATLIEVVNDPVSHDHAVSVQSDLAAARRFLEKSRKELKAPVIELGKAIDAVAKKEDAELEKEVNRVQSLVNDFQTLELAKLRAAENARRLEEERLEAARQAEMRKIQEAEEATRRKLMEREHEAIRAAQQAQNAQEAAAAASLQREITRQQELAAAESIERQDAIQEKFNAESAALPVPEQHKAQGQRVTESWEVTVSDIWTLARAHPSCVKMEPLVSEIKKLLDLGVKVHGVTAKKVVSSTTTTRRAIDI